MGTTHSVFTEGDDVVIKAVRFEECTRARLDSFGRLEPDPESAQPLQAYDEEVQRLDGSTETVRRDRWLYVFRVEEAGGGNAPVDSFEGWTSEGDGAPPIFRLDDGTERKVALSEYTVDTDGTYQEVTGEGNDRSPEGPTRSEVHLTTKTPYDHGPVHYVWLSPHPLASARIDQIRQWLLRGQAPRFLTPLRLSRDTFPEVHATPTDEGKAVLKARVCQVTRLVRDRLATAEDAHDRYLTWTEKMKGADQVASLLSRPCYDDAHGRTYLSGKLATTFGYHADIPDDPDISTPRPRVDKKSVASEYDMNSEKTWGDFSLREATGSERAPSGPDGHHLVAHFQYGAQCQRTALRRDRVDATEDAEALMRTPAFRAAVDAAATYTDDVAKALSGPEAGAVADRLWRLFARLSRVGGGGATMATMLRNSDLIDAGTEMSTSEIETLLADLQAIGDPEPAEILSGLTRAPKGLLDSTAFKVLFVLARRATKAPAAFTTAVAPAAQTFTLSGSVQRSGPPPGAAFLAALLQTTHTNADGTYSVHTKGTSWRIRGPSGDILLAKVRLSEIEHHVPVKGVRWRLNATGQLQTNLQEAGKALGLTNRFHKQAVGVLEVVNVILAGGRMYLNAQRDRLSMGDAIATVQALANAADPTGQAIENTPYLRLQRMKLGRTAGGKAAIQTARRVGRVLMEMSTYLDAMMAAYGAAEQWTDVDRFGQVAVEDANVWGGVGELAMGAGGAFLGAAILGPAGILAGTAGVLLTVSGGYLLWDAETSDFREMAEADPLWSWLPAKTFWGENPEPGRKISEDQQKRLFDLVRPDKADEADPVPDALAKQMGTETEGFVETAFWFPASADVKHADGASPRTSRPDGLRLSVALGYLPDYGTLMMNVNAAGTRDTGMGDTVNISCAVHYVKSDGRIRYCVQPEGTPLEIPKDTTLKELARTRNWARAPMRSVTAPNGETGKAAHLQVHVGNWPVQWHDREKRETARNVVRMHIGEGEMEFSDWLFGSLGIDTDARDDALMAKVDRARRVLRDVDPTSVLPAPDGLGGVLQSGRFTVTGSVYFAPLRPFDPSPPIPTGETEALFARAVIGGSAGFTYPDDV